VSIWKKEGDGKITLKLILINYILRVGGGWKWLRIMSKYELLYYLWVLLSDS
jgi:hypothetical protein